VVAAAVTAPPRRWEPADVLRPVPNVIRDDPPPCRFGDCDGSGWLLDEDANVARRCRCRDRADSGVTGRLRGGIPKRMLGASLDRHPDLDPSLVRHVRRFMAEIEANVAAGRGLWFHGTVGTGKTTLALLVARTARDAGCSVAIYSVPLLFAELRSTFGEESEDTHLALFRRLAEVELLVLDDLGAERQTEWVLEQLYSLVNERWQDQRSIVVTSNVPDPYRDSTLATLRHEIAELRRRRRDGAGRDELEGVTTRLERVAAQLAAGELSNDADPLTWLRQQVGARTVSRLIQICDDPLLMMGSDLRMRAGA
jgi:DNA replication protein DnaC